MDFDITSTINGVEKSAQNENQIHHNPSQFNSLHAYIYPTRALSNVLTSKTNRIAHTSCIEHSVPTPLIVQKIRVGDRLIIFMNCINEIHSPSNSLTCLKIFARALGIFKLMHVHGVPPVHGKLIQIKGMTSPSNELTLEAILIWLSTSLRVKIKLFCELQDFALFGTFPIRLAEFGFRMTANFDYQSLGIRLGKGSPHARHSGYRRRMYLCRACQMFGGSCTRGWGNGKKVDCKFPLLCIYKWSAACKTLDPWTSLYHLLFNCSSNHDR